MRRAGFGIALAVWQAAPAAADTLVATRPGLMCSGAWALAVLTLPDGSSRAASKQARREDSVVKQRGGCVDFAPGLRATLVMARFNTSVVRVAAQDGQPVGTFTVPNIDFKLDQAPAETALAPPGAPAAQNIPPADAPAATVSGLGDENPLPGLATARDFFAGLASTCPQQGWTEYRLTHTQGGPVDAIYERMTGAQQRAAQNEADLKCQDVPGLSCPTDTVFGFMVRAGYLDDMVRAACAQKPR